MQLKSSQSFYLFCLALVIFLVHFLSPMLTPFMLGIILAYLANPAVKWLDRKRLPHLISVILIFVIVFGVLTSLILMVLPLIQRQIDMLVQQAPKMLAWVNDTFLPWLQDKVDPEALQSALTSSLPKAGWLLTFMVHSGSNIIDLIVNFILTPVVTFYLLRDWDKILLAIRKILPSSVAPTTIKLAKQCDEVLGAFFRGQLLIMLALSLIYATGLTLVGLQLGLIIGFIGGVLSIVPYLGSIFVVLAGSIAAMVQFGDWHAVSYVLVVYAIGQVIEGYVLTPYLIGGRIGLHPVAVIFAIMAGGTLFGFFGVLLALPVAAIIMVFVRHLKFRYLASA